MTNKAMTKAELVSAIAETSESEKATVTRILDAVALVVSKEVADGGAVALPGLGKFASRERPERMVRNPATNELVPKQADRAVKFTVSKALKDAVND